MNRFAELLDRLAYEPGRNNKLRLITSYFREVEDPDRGYALAALTGALSFKHAKPALIRDLIMARTDPVLFALSHDYVGDFSETVALMWPKSANNREQSLLGYPPPQPSPSRGEGAHSACGPRSAGSPRMILPSEILPALFFYLFAGFCVVSAFMVIAARNPVHSVLFLILAFVNASGLFMLLGAEFLAMILIVVYVGAVAVLFLFVVMMLDVDFAELRQGFLDYLPIGGVIGLVFLVELLLVLGAWVIGPDVTQAIASPMPDGMTNTEALGRILYTRYIYYFQAAGVVLLVAMIGAIVLSLRHKPNVKRQNIADQVARTRATAMEIRQVRPGQGL